METGIALPGIDKTNRCYIGNANLLQQLNRVAQLTLLFASALIANGQRLGAHRRYRISTTTLLF